MNHLAPWIAFCLAATAATASTASCVGDSAEEPFDFPEHTPVNSDGKSDEPAACGDESCSWSLCGYDCSTQGQQCEKSCAASDERAAAFVQASVSGSVSASFDSRTNPFDPVFSVRNVLVYGCELWDFSNGEYDGLEVEYEEVIRTSIVANSDVKRLSNLELKFYAKPFTGPGSYQADARFRENQDAPVFGGTDACSVDVEVDAAQTVSGAFSCTIPSEAGRSVTVKGTFGCPKNALSVIFSRWAAAPQ